LGQETNNLSKSSKGSWLSAALVLMLAICSELFAAPISYSYDNLNRLTSTNYNNGQQIITYSYDLAGNLLSVNRSSPDTDDDGTIDSIDTDDDNDGLPDSWEILYGSNPLIADANLHSDNDGYTNLQEYQAGTDPTDDTSIPSVLSFALAAYTVNETDGIIGIPVVRTGSSTGAVSVTCQTSDGTAESGSDYTAVANGLNWTDGDSTAKYCNVAITSDATTEEDQTFTLSLNTPSGAIVGAINSTDITITEISDTQDDFNGDNKSDLLVRHEDRGQLYLYEMNGNQRTGSNIGGLSTGWTVKGLADLGGDGKADILVRRNSDGYLYFFEMDGNSKTGSSIGALSTSISIAGLGDLGGDGKDDIVLRAETGFLSLYEMDGNSITPSDIGPLSATWTVEGIGDFGGDGKDDLLIRNSNTGQLYLYEMSGNQRTGSNIGGLSLDWNIAGIGDLGGDGKDDIVIRHGTSGQLYLYEMSGNQRTGSNIGGLNTAWDVVRIADYSGDGKADIMVRNKTSGQLYLYEMNRNARTGSNVGGLSNSWQVQ